MKRKSLEKELKKLRYYLKITSKENIEPNSLEQKIVANTIVGMIMTINNLISTNAYNLSDNSLKEIYKLTDEARDVAIYYGYFSDFNDVFTTAKTITSKMPTSFSPTFADSLPLIPSNKPNNYTLITLNPIIEVKEVTPLNDFILFRNVQTKEEVYIPKENILQISNPYSKFTSYLIKTGNEPLFFYKSKALDTTVKIDFNALLKTSLADGFSIGKTIDINLLINKLISSLKGNPYRNVVVSYLYDGKSYIVPIHSILKDILNERKIDEKILNSKYTIIDYKNQRVKEPISIGNVSIADLAKGATLSDLFFIEVFLKRYDKCQSLKVINLPIEQKNYAYQSMLISLFQIGPDSLSNKFIKADHTNQFYVLYNEIKKRRNELAHQPLTSIQEKTELIRILDTYFQEFYNILSKVYNVHKRERNDNPFYKIKTVKNLDNGTKVINVKDAKYIALKHSGVLKIIDGKKYLLLDVEPKNTYLEIDGSLYILDYNTRISNECIVPIDYHTFVRIDPNTSKVSTSRYKPKLEQIVSLDYFSNTLTQAHDYLKNLPQYKGKSDLMHFNVITYLDEKGQPTYTEGLKNVIYRRFSQKIIPTGLVYASKLIIPNDPDEPLTIVDSKDTPLAKIYVACVKHVDNEEILSQFLTNKSEKPIEYGKLLPKDLKTTEITRGRKW